MNLLDFPDEILEKIFVHVVPELVIDCKSDENKWQLSLPLVSRRFLKIFPQLILEKVRFLPHRPRHVIAFFNYMKMVIGSESVIRIAYVSELTIDGCMFASRTYPPEDFSYFYKTFRHAVNLTHLTLLRCTWFWALTGNVAWFDCPNLTTLKLRHHHPFSETFYATLANPGVFPKLKHLSVGVLGAGESSSRGYYLSALATGLAGTTSPELKSVRLSDPYLPGRLVERELAPVLGGFEKLDLGISWSAPACEAIGKQCCRLKELLLSDIDDECFKVLFADTLDNAGFRTAIQNVTLVWSSVSTEVIPLLVTLPNLKLFKMKYSRKNYTEEELAEFQHTLPMVKRHP